MKKLSIITICYNEPNLEKTCESIVNQTWQDFEWIVIDGGSDSATKKVWDKYKYRIDTFISERDNGIYNACNKGINLSSGEFINILNAGDCFHSNDVLEKVFSKNYDADILYGNELRLKKNGKPYIVTLPPKLNFEFLINGNISTPAMFIKRELFELYGDFNENYKIASDFEKWIIFLKNSKVFEHIDIIIDDFDMNGISSNSENKLLHQREREEILRNYFSQEEIEQLSRKYKNFSFWEKIFSVTDTLDKNHRTITFLGIHFNIRRKANA